VAGIRISRNDLPGTDRVVAYLPDQFGAEETFAVVFENDGVDLGKPTPNVVGDARDLRRGRGANLLPIHEAQLLSYLKLSGHRVGLLINFNSTVLSRSVRRIVNNL
jgi:hypothetical protein